MQETKQSEFATSHGDLVWRVITQSRGTRIFWITWFALVTVLGVGIAIADVVLMVRAFTG